MVEYFVKRFAEKLGKRISKIDTRTLQLCEAYPWSGEYSRVAEHCREIGDPLQRRHVLD